MKYALFIAETSKSPSSSQRESDWKSFVDTAKSRIQGRADVEALNVGAYLCNLSGGLNMLSTLTLCATDWNIQSRTVFFDQEPPFVITKAETP